MAKHLYVLCALIVLQAYLRIEAAPNSQYEIVDSKPGENSKIEQGGPDSPRLDNEAEKLSDTPIEYDAQSSQGQRQKRFYNDFMFGFSPFGPYIPNFFKRDGPQDTGNVGAENFLAEISSRVQYILNYTRQRAHFPQPIPIPSYIPILYIPRSDCSCTNDNEKPNNDKGNSDEPIAPHTTISTLATTNPHTASPAHDNAPVTPSSDDDTKVTSPDLFVRFPVMNETNYDEDEDGARPISFVPIRPNITLSRPPPPVEHGSKQAGSDQEVKNDVQEPPFAPSTTTSIPVANAPALQLDQSTNVMPTLCDGAVLICCHKLEVTYDCFLKQGCPDPTPYSTPCDENVILGVIRKFQYYYANRRG